MKKKQKKPKKKTHDGAKQTKLRPDLSAPQHRRGTLLLGMIGIALMVFLAYAPAVQNTYIWDDDDYVHENPLLGAPDGLWEIWFGFDLVSSDPVILKCATPQYYPIVFSTFYIEHALWGIDPAGYHVTNILFHALNAVLVFVLLRRLGLSPAVAWVAAALFGVHPVEVESVAWVSERKNVLSAFFYLLAFLAYLRFSDSGSDSGSKSGLKRYYFLSLLLFVCALLSKSVTATLPVIIVLAEYFRRGRISARLVVLMAPYLVIGLCSGALTAHIEHHHVGASGAEWGFSLIERGLIASRALCFYASKLVVPYPLTFIYGRWQIDAGALWQYLFPLIVALTALFAFLLRNRVGRLPFFGIGFFAISLAPALGFVDFYPQIYSFVADHFQYIGSLGVLILIAAAGVWLVARLPSKEGRLTVGVVAAALVLTTLGLLTRAQCRIYEDRESLWLDTIAKNDEDFLGHNNLGMLYLKKASEVSLTVEERTHYMDKAEHMFLASMGNNPLYAKAFTNMTGALLLRGKAAAAEPVCLEALKLQPEAADAHHGMGMVLRGLKRFEEAEKEFLEAIRLDPLYVAPSGQLGGMAEGQGRLDVAEEHYRRVLQLRPRSLDAHIRLLRVLKLRAKTKDVVEVLRSKLKLQPENLNDLNELARILATSTDDGVRNGAEAVKLALEACELTGFKKAKLVATLAAAYAETGQFEQAVELQQQVVFSAPPKQRKEQKRILELYKSDKPLRE